MLVGATGEGDLHHGNRQQKLKLVLGVASHLVNADSFAMSRKDERRLRKTRATMTITATSTTTTTLTAMMMVVGESWALLLTDVVAGASLLVVAGNT